MKMKKTIYTLLCISFFAIANAQSSDAETIMLLLKK